MEPSEMPCLSVGQTGLPAYAGLVWEGPLEAVALGSKAVRRELSRLEKPLFVLATPGGVGLAEEGELRVSAEETGVGRLLGLLPPLTAESLGSEAFRRRYGLKYAYGSGAMANGIASEDLVIALGKKGMLGSFGAAGLSLLRIESAIDRIQAALPGGPFAFNLIHTLDESIEMRVVELYLRRGVRVVEASAFMGVTPALVWYRAAGLGQGPNGEVEVKNRIIAKLSRREVAEKFLAPAPAKLLGELVAAGRITELQAQLAAHVPLADDITTEADSAGHTDNRPLVVLLPMVCALRDEAAERYGYAEPIHVGAAGGIGTPQAVLGAFAMGADYVVTGSINQACVESGTSDTVRRLLAGAEMTDVAMAPAADMFEMGVRVQVLKGGSLYPMRGQRLYELYMRYKDLEDIPLQEKERLEKQILHRPVADIWEETERFFAERDPAQLARAREDPHLKMALVFRWYLGLASRWAIQGDPEREKDFQIWCGPAMGGFNRWAKGTYLEDLANRHVDGVAMELLCGCAYLARVRALRNMGVQVGAQIDRYTPQLPVSGDGETVD